MKKLEGIKISKVGVQLTLLKAKVKAEFASNFTDVKIRTAIDEDMQGLVEEIYKQSEAVAVVAAGRTTIKEEMMNIKAKLSEKKEELLTIEGKQAEQL